MLTEIQSAVRNLLAREGHLHPSDVDVRFSAPTAAWLAELGRPTLNLYLHEITENTVLRSTQPFTVPHGPGHALHRQPPRRIDLQFSVSAHAAHPDDARALLWRALHTLMRHPELPPDLLPDVVTQSGVPTTAHTAQPDPQRRAGNWLTSQFPPSTTFAYVLTVPLELNPGLIVPLALRRELRVGGEDGAHETAWRNGWILQDAQGEPIAGIPVRVEGDTSELRTNNFGQLIVPRAPRGPTAALVLIPGIDGGVLVTLDPEVRTVTLSTGPLP